MRTVRQKYKFKKGQKLHLDQIYMVQGLAVDIIGNWWEYENGLEASNELVVTQNVEFEIIIKDKRKAAQ